MDPLVIVFGLGVGILVGLTGIGGGSLMTPLLIVVIGVQPVVAIGTDLAYGAITKTVGGWRHLRQGTVDMGVSKWLAFGSVPGSVAGVLLVDRLDLNRSTLLALVAAALFVVALATLGRALFIRNLRERESVLLSAAMKLGSVVTGAVLGVVLGLTSVGSGALIGPVLIILYRLTPARVVGTDVFHAAIMLWAAGLTHLFVGNVDFLLMANILIGSLPGVLIGSALVPKVPSTVLRPTLGCVLLGSALGVASKAGADIPVAAIFGVPLAVGVVAFLIHRVRPLPDPEPLATAEPLPA